MNCTICRVADTRVGTATVTLEREGTTLVVKGVPANVCPNCGEEYVESDVSARVMRMANDAAKNDVVLDVLEYDDGLPVRRPN